MTLSILDWAALIITVLNIILPITYMVKNKEIGNIPAVFGWSAALMFEIVYFLKIY